MEDIEKDEKNTISIKIKNLTKSINAELKFIKRNDDEELVFYNKNSENIIKTGEDLINFIKNYFKIPYKNLKLIYINSQNRVSEDDEISEIISTLEDRGYSGFIVVKEKEEKKKEDEYMTLFLKTSKNIKEDKLTLENRATLLNLKEKIKNLTNIEIDNQKIKFKENEIKDNNKKLKYFGITDGCTIQMELIKEDNDGDKIKELLENTKSEDIDYFERKTLLLNNLNNPVFEEFKKIFNIDEKLKDPKLIDLLCNPKYDSYFGISRTDILFYNEDKFKNIMKFKDSIDSNI